MKSKLFLIFFLLMSFWHSSAQLQITRIEGSPYPASSVPDRLFLTSDSYTYSQKIILQSIQGLLARTKPEILRDVHGHVSYLENYVQIDRTYYNNFNGLLQHFANRFNGYILCDARTSSVNAAFSISSILNAIVVPADLEQTAINIGYVMVIDVRGKNESWVLENYGDQLNKSIASYQNSPDDRALFLGDYSVFSGALQFWDGSATGNLAKSVYSRMNPNAVYFGWGPGEYETVEQLSRRSAIIHPADWSPNLSTLSNIPAKLPRQKKQKAPFKVVPDVHTVCFVITDGDNIQWMSGTLNNKGNWANPDNARLKLGWTVSPAFAELAPTIYKKYIENAINSDGARNQLIAGPSGTGYYFPSIYPQLAQQSVTMNRMMKKADLNIVNIIDVDGQHNPDEYLKQSNVDALFYYSYGGQYTKLAGQLKWYKGKPSIGGRFTLWGNTNDGSAETRERVCQNLANTLNQQSTNINTATGYSLIPVHIWTMGPSDVLNLINKLNPNIRVVSPDEFVWLIKKNVGKINLGDGNGLQAEYRLNDSPDNPILTTTEPTIDFDDEYSTEATDILVDKSFTARWVGEIRAVYSEEYTFHITANGGVMLKINGQILCDALNNPSVHTSNTISLVSGEMYDIEYIYKKNSGKAQTVLEWESPSQVRQRVPHHQFYSRPVANTGLVTIFEESHFSGYSNGLEFGKYSMGDLKKKGFSPSQIKSLKVTDGFKVILFSENNFTGESLVIENDFKDFNTWNHDIQSIQVTNAGENLPDGTYFIKSKNSESVIGIEGSYLTSTNGAKARLMRNTGNINLQFKITRNADGTYRIESLSSGKSLEISDFSKNTNTIIQQWRSNDEENQKFIITSTSDGVCKIYSNFSDMLVESESTSSLAYICQTNDLNSPNSEWQILSVPPLPNGNGDGLTGYYYNGLNFNTFILSRIDPTVNFNWETGRPDRSLNVDNFSVRWEGKIEPRASGEYVFYINSDNGRRLWVNNQLIIDKWLDDYDIEYSGSITLQADQLYDIKLEYYEKTGGAYCRLEWINPRQPREIISRSQLYSLNYNNVEDLLLKDEIEIFPFPAKNEVNFKSLDGVSISQFQIIDISGRIIKKAAINSPENRIDISEIPPGIYSILLIKGGNKIVRKLMVR